MSSNKPNRAKTDVFSNGDHFFGRGIKISEKRDFLGMTLNCIW